MGKHTEGLLKADEQAILPINADGRLLLASVFKPGDHLHLTEEGKANARRLVACWNMAEELGLSTEAIEAGVVKDMMDFIQWILDIGKERDCSDSPVVNKANIILAKLKGE